MESGLGALAGQLGPSAAAVAVTVLFIGFLKYWIGTQKELYNQLFQQLEQIAKDKGEAIRSNTQAMAALQIAFKEVSDRVVELHDALNSRLSALVEATRLAAHAQGVVEGSSAEKDRVKGHAEDAGGRRRA